MLLSEEQFLEACQAFGIRVSKEKEANQERSQRGTENSWDAASPPPYHDEQGALACDRK